MINNIMDIKKETEEMKETAKKLFRDKEDRKEFCEFCDKTLRNCSDEEHFKKRKKKV
jgi:hypothetical protein